MYQENKTKLYTHPKVVREIPSDLGRKDIQEKLLDNGYPEINFEKIIHENKRRGY